MGHKPPSAGWPFTTCPRLRTMTGPEGISTVAGCLPAYFVACFEGLAVAVKADNGRSPIAKITFNVAEISDRTSARAWVDQWFRTIEPEQNLDDGHDYTLAWLEETIREARVRHGCRWVILDPWNEIEHVWERGRSETQYINDALRRLKRLARAHHIILMVVAHPSKEGARLKDIADLDLYSISGSAAWANKADHGIILHRPDNASEEVHIKVAKSKDHAVMGLPGTVTMRYVPMKARYAFVRMGI
jgi:hypothetical protein